MWCPNPCDFHQSWYELHLRIQVPSLARLAEGWKCRLKSGASKIRTSVISLCRLTARRTGNRRADHKSEGAYVRKDKSVTRAKQEDSALGLVYRKLQYRHMFRKTTTWQRKKNGRKQKNNRPKDQGAERRWVFDTLTKTEEKEIIHAGDECGTPRGEKKVGERVKICEVYRTKYKPFMVGPRRSRYRHPCPRCSLPFPCSRLHPPHA